ncbi:MAG: D-alanyl-D-alanine carboxypeptidase [Lactobacillales bacterium]|nr:D-alanyl-D-alanine carboxypeptidase [Lactobacillales bacterium]
MFIKKFTKKLTLITVTAITLGTSLFSSIPAFADESGFEAAAESAIAIDEKTGKIFYAKDADKVRGIASITKILTVYLVLDQIKSGKLKWDDKVEIDDYTYAISSDNNLSNVPLEPNAKYTVKELYEAALISSANACAIALATKVAGSEKKFVALMNKQVKKWGITDAKLINSTGLNNENIPEQYRYPNSSPTEENQMSAKDVALIAQHLIQDFPEVLETTKKTEGKFGVGTSSEVDMQTWNWMLPDMDYAYEGVDGLKTGTTTEAGQCFVGTATRKDWRIITVVLHADNSDLDTGARFTATGELMDFVYNNWSQKEILKKGTTFKNVKPYPVKDGKEKEVALELNAPVTTWIRSDMDDEKYKVDFRSGKEKELIAPVDKGTVAGMVTVSLEQDNLGYILKKDKVEYPMVAKKSIKRSNFFAIIGEHFLEFINSHL